MAKSVAIIGYSGHAHTGIDILMASGYAVKPIVIMNSRHQILSTLNTWDLKMILTCWKN